MSITEGNAENDANNTAKKCTVPEISVKISGILTYRNDPKFSDR